MQHQYILRIVIACSMIFVCASVNEVSFGYEVRHYSIKEGDDVQIRCNVSNRYPTVLFKDMLVDDDIEIVRNWSLVNDANKYTYSFNSHNSFLTHSLLLKNASKFDDGKYTCLQPPTELNPLKLMTLALSVLYKSSHPECYDYDQNIYFADDDVEFNLRCVVTDIGNPPVKATFSGLKNETLPTVQKITADGKLMTNLTFYPSMSMNNTHISCTTSQEFHDIYEQHNQTCSFTPILILEELETVIHPADGILSVQEPSTITILCSSNAGYVPEFQWNILSKIPDGVTYLNRSNHLLFSIENTIDDINASIGFECSANLRNHSSIKTGSLTINYTHSNISVSDPISLLYIILVSVLICSFLIGLLIYCVCDQRHGKSVRKGGVRRALPLTPSYEIPEIAAGLSNHQLESLPCTSISFSEDKNGDRGKDCHHQNIDIDMNKTGSKKRQRVGPMVPGEFQPVSTTGSNSDVRNSDNNDKEEEEWYLTPDVDTTKTRSANDPSEMGNEREQSPRRDLVKTYGDNDVYELVNKDYRPLHSEERFYHGILRH